ncbi:MAG: hypothetical protein HY063_09320 [Bacteroidetes bacterium]|nr:hypothetical protein [Bacteroidota bacterium]
MAAKTPKTQKVRVNKSPKLFDPYITRTDDRLLSTEPTTGNPYWQFLGLSSANATDWHNKRVFWDTPLTGLHALYVNPLTSTGAVKEKVKLFIESFRIFANPLLSIIAASSNATADEEKIFHLKLNVNRQKPTHTHTKIADQCFTAWTGEGAGSKKASSHTTHEAQGRPSVAAGADGVQYAYVIMDENPKTIAARTAAVVSANEKAAANAKTANQPAPEPAPLPQPVPQHPDDGTRQEFFSGATKQFNFGADKEGKFLCVWSRWYNSKHPELAGDWNEMQTVRI